MTLYSKDPTCEIHQGHVIDVLAALLADSIDCCVTSPPYWALRKYAGEQEVDWPDGSKAALGLESTPELYLSHLVEIFSGVRRVLKPWGTCFINLGDSYWGGKGQSGQGSPEYQALRQDISLNKPYDHIGGPKLTRPSDGNHPVIKPLDLCGIPESLVLALRADGWYWRSTIIWAKTNPMPESVAGWAWLRHKVKAAGRTEAENEKEGENNRGSSGLTRPTLQALWQDCPGCPICNPNDGLVLRKGSWRPTSSFEYVFMLAKSKDYFGDGENVREPQSRNWANENTGSTGYTDWQEDALIGGHRKRTPAIYNPNGRNLRDVWTINTQPFKGAHFATFPEDLVTKPILASTSDKGNCPKCGMPWVRVLSKYQTYHDGYSQAKGEEKHNYKRLALVRQSLREHGMEVAPSTETLSWRASCSCGIAETVPAIVLDPFCGSGTTGIVAKRLGRRAILIDLSAEYCEMAMKRVGAETSRMI